MAQLAEIDRPEFLAHGLEHLDRHDVVVFPGLVAVILQRDVGPLPQTVARIFGLFDRQRQALGREIAACHGPFGETAPAAADLQQAARIARQVVDDAVVFAMLGRGQVVARRIDARAVGHAVIQPQAIELIAQVVMRLDVATRPGLGVAVEEIERLGRHRLQPVAIDVAVQHVLVQQGDGQQGLEVGGVAPAVAIGFGHADVALGGQRGHHAPVMDDQMRVRAGMDAAKGMDGAIGRSDGQRAAFDTLGGFQELA